MLSNSNGKLLIYASSFASRREQLEVVNVAAERTAELFKLSVEVVTYRKQFDPIYVYYVYGDEEPIPIYCNRSEESNINEVCTTLRNMMFVLSFHPKHSALKQMRKEAMQFS
jgi:hypothetical protein